MANAEIRVSTSNPSQWGRVLSIEVPRARFDAVRAAVVRDLRKRVVRPGFRRGHVPAAILERDFADDIRSTTLEKFIPEVYDEAIRDQSLDVISSPKVQNLKLDDPQVVGFDVEVEVRPALTLAPLDGLRGTRWTLAVGPEWVARALDDLREQHAQFVAVERPAQDGDFVQVTYVPLDAQGAERHEQEVDNYSFQLGAGDVVAEFEAAVRGLTAGQTARASVQYPADNADPELAGKTVAFILTVQAVKEKRLPDADDEFARDLGVDTLVALRERIAADLERRVRDDSERDLRESLVDHLIQANPFAAPQSMLESYVESVLADYDASRRRAGLDPDDTRRQELVRAAQPAGERAVKRALVLEHIAAEHGLHASEEDVDKWIEDKVQAGGPGASAARAFFAEARRRRRLRGEITDDRVFEVLKSKAEIATVERTPDVQAG